MRQILKAAATILALLFLTGCTIVLPPATVSPTPDETSAQFDPDVAEAMAACDEISALIYSQDSLNSAGSLSEWADNYSKAAVIASKTALLSEAGPVFQQISTLWLALEQQGQFLDEESFKERATALADAQVTAREAFLGTCDRIVQ